MRKSILASMLLFYAITVSSQVSMFKEVSDTFLKKLIDTAKAHYPHLKIEQAHIKMAENNLKKSKLSWFEAISFSFVYSPKNTTTLLNQSATATLLNGYQAGLNINVGGLLQKPYNIKQARLEVQNSQSQMDEYLLTLERMVTQRYYEYVQTVNLLKLTLRAGYDIESALEKTKYKFEKGEVPFEDYNGLLISVVKANQEQLSSELSLMVAKTSLEELLGVKLETIK